MDDDSIFRRVSILAVHALVKERYTGTGDTMAIAKGMIRNLNRAVARSVDEFERGEGDFDACYLEAVRSINDK